MKIVVYITNFSDKWIIEGQRLRPIRGENDL